MKAIQLVKYGSPEDAFKISEIEKPRILAGEVLIKVESFGLNFADVMARRGLYKAAPPIPAVLGYEVVGRISEMGADVKSLQTGQKVVAFTRFGAYAEYAKTHCSAVSPISDSMDNGTATALSTQYCTAIYAAYEMANIQSQEYVLVHVAAGGVGIALVQLALNRGCKVIGTVGSEKKIQFLKKMGVEHAINYLEKDFEEEIPKILGDRKVDVIFDPVGGNFFKKDRSLLNTGGRIIVYGASDQLNRKKGFVSKLKLMMAFGFMHPVGLMLKSQGVIGVNMLQIADNRPEVLQRSLNNVVKLYQQGRIKPYVGKEFSAQEIANAHAYFEARESIGKVVLHWA